MDHSNPSSSKEAPSGSNTTAMAACALRGGCPSDYVAVGIAAAAFLLLLICAVYPFLVRKGPRTKSSGFWLVITQILGSFNLTLGLMMSVKYIKFDKRHPWQSCYIWAVWFEGPLGFGLLMSCRIVQAYQLYHLFVKRRLPPIRASVLLPLILLPWIGGAAFIHISKPLNSRCHMRTQWVVPVVCIHMLYVAVLFGITRAIRHIEFRFHEFKDLLRGIIVSTVAIGLWVVAYVLNEVHEDVPWVQVTSRFLLLVMVSILVMAFFSMSFSQPLLSQMSLRKRGSLEYMTMGTALGIPDSGLIQKSAPIVLNVNEPLDKLLLNKRFRQSFMDFADSCLAGESVHFYDEVHELRKIPVDDPVRRVYMARHIVEKYIVTGAEMEVNVSHRTRQEILGTQDLADLDLFNHAVIELMQLVKMNLVKDYWSSTFFLKFKEESCKESNGYDPIEHLGGWEFSPRLSCVHGGDDPFHQEHKGNSDSDV